MEYRLDDVFLDLVDLRVVPPTKLVRRKEARCLANIFVDRLELEEDIDSRLEDKLTRLVVSLLPPIDELRPGMILERRKRLIDVLLRWARTR